MPRPETRSTYIGHTLWLLAIYLLTGDSNKWTNGRRHPAHSCRRKLWFVEPTRPHSQHWIYLVWKCYLEWHNVSNTWDVLFPLIHFLESTEIWKCSYLKNTFMLVYFSFTCGKFVYFFFYFEAFSALCHP